MDNVLHLLGIGLGSTCHEVAGTLHTHAHCHVRLSGTGSIRAGGLKSLCHSRLYKAFPYRGVAHHGTLIPHVDESLAFLVIADAADTHSTNIHAPCLCPVLVQNGCHILGQLHALGRQGGDADTVYRHLSDR